MGIFSGIGSTIAGGLIGGIFGQHSANQQFANNKEMIELQNKLNVDNYKHRYQWAMQDMQEAGLNPILAATQGIGGNIAGASALASQNNMGASVAAGMSAGASASSAAAQKQQANTAQSLADSQIDKNRADAAASTASATGMQLNNQLVMDTYNKRLEMFDVKLDNMRKEGRNIDSNTAKQMFELEVVLPTQAALNLSNATLASNTASLRSQELLTERERTEEYQISNRYAKGGSSLKNSNYIDSINRLGMSGFDQLGNLFEKYKRRYTG